MPTTTTTSPAPSPILGITGNETPRETLEVIRNFVGIVSSGRAEPGQPDEGLFLFHYRITELGAPDGAFVPFDDDIVVDAGFGVKDREGFVVEYAFAVGRGTELLLAELPPEFHEPDQPLDEISPDHRHERERIREALQLENGRISAAAERIGMSRATFWRKRQRYGL